ncbi:sigma-70 family RNA polymerase sigma factor [Streptomyces sp. NPDC047002]|uniref:RNA polymerase sigma factor n=1 Tax=Streptomyces sp. NPDC047002 TaxID=3155475 RepID=UPI0034565E7F
MRGTPPENPSDAELLRAARAGEMPALGALLERHRAGMRAVALSLLGHGPDAEDAVQDAALTALRHLGDVRRPESAGAWLRMVVRNACRDRLRAPGHAALLADPLGGPPAAEDTDPARALERHALRDWLWRAMDDLSPTLRMTLMLRYFSPRTPSYDRIAAVCGVPVGTVRSRLAEGRAKLADAMAATAEAAHGDAAARTRASADDAVETLAAAEAGRFGELAAERWTPDVAYYEGGRRVGGRDFLVRGMEGDLAAGVRQRLVSAVTSRDTTIWEMDLLSPPDAPDHCPPAVAWLMTAKDGRMHRLRLFHAPAAAPTRA